MQDVRAFLVVAAVLAVLVLSPMSALAFPDAKGHWAEAVVNEMATRAIIEGYEDGTFRPDATVSREETVTMVSRLFPGLPDKPQTSSKQATRFQTAGGAVTISTPS